MSNTKISALTSAATPLAGTETLPIVQSGATVKVSVNNLTVGKSVDTGLLSVSAAQNTDGQIRISNSTSRASGNKYGVRFADNGFETNGAIYVEQKTSSNNQAEMVFVANNATGGVQITSGTEFMRGYGNGDVSFPSGNLIIATSGKGIDFSATPGTGTSELLADYEEGTWTPAQGSGLTVVGAFSSSGTYTKVGRQVTVIFSVSGATTIAVTAGGSITNNLPFTSLAGIDSAGTVFRFGAGGGQCIAGNTSTTVYNGAAVVAGGGISISISYFV